MPSKQPDSEVSRAVVTRVKVSFFVSGALAGWKAFAETIGMKVKPATEPGIDEASFVALPASVKKGVFYLIGGFHSTGPRTSDRGTVHWHLEWEQAPEDEPPDEMREKSAAVGGYPAALSRMIDAWPLPSRDVELEFDLSLHLGSKKIVSTALAGPVAVEIDQAGHTFSQKTMLRSWDVKPPLGIITSLSFVHLAAEAAGQPSHLIVAGKVQMPLSADLATKLEGKVWHDLTPIVN